MYEAVGGCAITCALRDFSMRAISESAPADDIDLAAQRAFTRVEFSGMKVKTAFSTSGFGPPI